MKRKKTMETQHGQLDEVHECFFCNIFTNAPMCDNFLQKECYQSLGMIAVVTRPAGIRDISDDYICEN
ncbi:hypothetical protein Tco_1213450 [Tanacetum coccineum]